jgi:nitrogen regulatory protein PII
MTQIELSQAELDLIQAKRDQEAAEEQQRQIKIQADIVKAKANIARRQEEDRQQNAAARAFQKELGEGWEERTREEERTERVYHHLEVVWSETYTDCRVYFEKEKYRVFINKHTTYGSAWGRGTDKGYKMFVSGPEIEYGYSQKALSKAATVNKKVQDCIDTINAREEMKKKKASAVETVVADLKEKFPTATIIAIKDWTRGYSSKNAYREYDKVTVSFPNGITMNYEIYSDSRLSRMSVLFDSKDEMALMNALSNITLPIIE